MKHKWIRRTELKAVEVERVQQLRAARVVRPSLWPRIQRVVQSVIGFFQKLGEAIGRAAIAVCDFLAKAVPVIEHEQHRQLAVGINDLLQRRQYSVIGEVKFGQLTQPVIPSPTINLGSTWS